MTRYSSTITGILISVVGTWLVNTLGISDACSNEFMARAVEFAPLVIGSAISWTARYNKGDISILGWKKPAPTLAS